MVAGAFQLQPETYVALASVQRSAARLNPQHEDNYYTAAAILAWNEQVEAAQDILQRATDSRLQDPFPAFFHGFNRYYFEQDAVGGAQDLLVAASRGRGGNQDAFTAIAAKWYEHANDASVALTVVNRLIESTRNKDLKRLLQARAQRLEGLILLQSAARKFQAERGERLAALDQLIAGGYVGAIPADPFGRGYGLDADGVPMLAKPKS